MSLVGWDALRTYKIEEWCWESWAGCAGIFFPCPVGILVYHRGGESKGLTEDSRKDFFGEVGIGFGRDLQNAVWLALSLVVGC